MPQHWRTVINVHLGSKHNISRKAFHMEFLTRATLLEDFDQFLSRMMVRDHSDLRLRRKAPSEVRDDRTCAHHIL
jgi:hypothetical protein